MNVILRRMDSGPHAVGRREVMGGESGDCKSELVITVLSTNALLLASLHFKEHGY